MTRRGKRVGRPLRAVAVDESRSGPAPRGWQQALVPLAHRVAAWRLRRPDDAYPCGCILSTYAGPSRENPCPTPGSSCIRMWVIVTRIQMGLLQLPHDHLSDAQVPHVIDALDVHLAGRGSATDPLEFAREMQRIILRPARPSNVPPTHLEGIHP